ncbi:hypothetical protein EDD16DRAFT_1584122 [Pisolithus croceorrhizus]|nr:hypothetical protein EDD16DRAFT_1584122 [Pisolithus croceorrhizus]
MYELVPVVFFVFSCVTRPDLGSALPTLGRPERVTVYLEATYFDSLRRSNKVVSQIQKGRLIRSTRDGERSDKR